MRRQLIVALVCGWLLIGGEAEAVYEKKGVGGPVPKEKLEELGVSWFYNWGINPNYKVNNWDAKVWKKFVPMFSPWQRMETTFATNSINQICQNTDYCGKGNYYLIGNEPDHPAIGEQERMGATIEEAAEISVKRHGEILKQILAKDETAKFIMVGFTYRNDRFVDRYIGYWKTYWQGDGVVADLPEVIRGWHIHTYGNYWEKPTNDTYVRDAVGHIDNKMVEVFGKKVVNQEIWVTEMGSLSGIPTEGSADRYKFVDRMREMVKTYENSSLINRYAWFYFGCNEGHAARCFGNSWASYNLYYPAGEGYAISDLGRLYKTLGLGTMPTPTVTAEPTVPVNEDEITCTGGCYGSLNNCSNNCSLSGCQQLTDDKMVEMCGWPLGSIAYRCCSINNAPTSVPTRVPTVTITPTEIPTLIPTPACKLCQAGIEKFRGDGNCDSRIDMADFSIWREEYLEDRSVGGSGWNADFDCDGRVTINDWSRWRAGYIDSRN